MEVSAKVQVIGYDSYDPLYARLRVEEGTMEKGHYLPDLGVIEQIWKVNENGYQEENVADQVNSVYVMRFKVSEQGFIRLKPCLQLDMMKQTTERLLAMSEILRQRFAEVDALSSEKANQQVLNFEKPKLGKGKGWMIDMK